MNREDPEVGDSYVQGTLTPPPVTNRGWRPV